MQATARSATPPVLKPLPLMPGPLASRPKLVAAIALGIVVGAAFAFIPNGFGVSTRGILTWDIACGFFLAMTFWSMRGRDARFMKVMAACEDEGGRTILVLTLIATVASLGAVAAELQQAKGGDGLEKAIRVGLAFGTVALSWTFVHLIFALHYAHQFYAPAKPDATKSREGLVFPGTKEPDYWDFLHFSLVIGVASQTADIQFTSRALRRIGTAQSVIAFSFNTVVLALTINLLASLF